MKCWLAILLLLLPVWARADGCAFGKGFTPQLRETHQLAVIHLTETTADVSMYIAIDGIPPGKPLTYVLPFWYRPDDFTMREESAESFRKECVASAHAAVEKMRRLSQRRGSIAILQSVAVLASAGVGILAVPVFSTARTKGRSSAVGSGPAPYYISETPHARAEFYRLGSGELPQLIAKAGLPARYATALAQYHTPYFAVMRLTGLAARAEEASMGRGIYYHFRHTITGGQYTYPLGTGAAWPQPIPLTEIYLTCPRDAALRVKAPIEGEDLGRHFDAYTRSLMSYLASTPNEQQKIQAYSTTDQMAEFLAPRMGSLIATHQSRYPLVWHVAYLQSNPSEDIRAQVVHRPRQPWQMAIADLFALPGVAPGICVMLFVLSWLVTIRLLVRPRWKSAGSPGVLARHVWGIFLSSQVTCFAILIILILVALLVVSIPAMLEQIRPIGFMLLLLSGVVLLVVAIVTNLRQAIKLSRRQPADSWDRGLPLPCWACSFFLFILASSAFYGLVYWCESLG